MAVPVARSDALPVLKALPLPLSVMVRPDDPLAATDGCSLRDLEGRPVALPTPDFGIRRELERACADGGIRLRSTTRALLREIAVRTGAAIFMPVQDTAAEHADGSLGSGARRRHLTACRLLALLAVTALRRRRVSTLTIRNFDDDLKAELRIRAARHGRSMESEARAILRSVLTQPEVEGGLGTRIAARFADLGDVELDLPTRTEPPRKVELPE